MNESALEGRTALVIGGAGGIGRAVAAAFVASGAQVFALDIDEATARRAVGGLGAEVVPEQT